MFSGDCIVVAFDSALEYDNYEPETYGPRAEGSNRLGPFVKENFACETNIDGSTCVW
jgi:hypothetical protein